MKILLTILLIVLAYLLAIFVYYILVPICKLLKVINKSGMHIIIESHGGEDTVNYTLKRDGKETKVEVTLPKGALKGRDYVWDLVEITQMMIDQMKEFFELYGYVETCQLSLDLKENAE